MGLQLGFRSDGSGVMERWSPSNYDNGEQEVEQHNIAGEGVTNFMLSFLVSVSWRWLEQASRNVETNLRTDSTVVQLIQSYKLK